MFMRYLVPFLSCVLVAQTLTLHSVQFSERKTVDLELKSHDGAPAARIEAEVRFRDGQAQIELKYRDLKPAVLFGGDITCYVLWAVTRDGSTENLGEVMTFDGDGSSDYATGLKSFALMITAEPYYLVDQASSMVMFFSQKPEGRNIHSEPFTFDRFAPAAKADLNSIALVKYGGKDNLVVTQAVKAFELAERVGAKTEAPAIHRDAMVALTQAKNLDSVNRRKDTIDYARRSVAHSNEAIRMTLRALEARELARVIAERKAEFAAMKSELERSNQLMDESRKARMESENALALAEQKIALAESKLVLLQQERQSLEQQRDSLNDERLTLLSERQALVAERDDLVTEKSKLNDQMVQLKSERQSLLQEKEALEKDRTALSNRLEHALSQVADTKASARGLIVSLPDILFDTNQAELKSQAQLIIAKMAGIMHVMPDLTIAVEGHTDATGNADYNLKLSERRAQSVVTFLQEQGIEKDRMTFVGMGSANPVAANDTAEGRAKNRRVELIVSQNSPKE